MRWGIFLSLITVSVCLVAHAAFAGEPAWALISTEVDDGLDGAGTFMDREVLQIWPPTWAWSWNPSDVFFDPGDLFGIETGLDAIHLAQQPGGSLLYFSTEVDFEYGGVAYQDEDLLVYDTSSGLVTSAFDVKDVLGDDYGLDAACWIYEPHDARWMLAFSTEVGGEVRIPDNGISSIVSFTDGDVLVTDGISIIGLLSLEEVFGRNVGLDALHGWIQESDLPDYEYELQILMSTEVDGSMVDVNDFPSDLIDLIPFRDQDLLTLTFALGEGPGPLIRNEVSWRGIEDGFGKDVGLDAVYIFAVPEPGTVLLAGLGLGALVLRLRRKR